MPAQAQTYVDRANHALDLATSETDAEARAALVRIAETWLRMAEVQMERARKDRASKGADT